MSMKIICILHFSWDLKRYVRGRKRLIFLVTPRLQTMLASKKKLNHTAAQDYCLKSLTKFSVRGKLAIFENDSGLANIRDFIKTIENNQENNMNIYWTGVKCESNTGHCKFSDGTDASFANKITGDDGICVAVPTHGHPKRSNCLKPNYFICKITNFSSQGIIT